ncbi:MAG: thioesterase family protein [Pseudomonadota bacterium]
MVSWPASIALSWLWGLGFFFSIHFAFSYGVVGLVLFALPNALGLFLFGLFVGRIGDGASIRRWIETAFSRYGTIFALYQLAALSLTIFALMAYLALPAGVELPLAVGFAVLAISVFVAEAVGFPRIRFLHAGLLGLFVLLALALYALASPSDAPRAPASGLGDGEFLSYLIPLTVGLLFGPWMDLQQWQRAVAVAESGRSVAHAFALGASIFFLILIATGSLGLWLVSPELSVAPAPIDGWVHAESVVAIALSGAGSNLYLTMFSLMAMIAVLTTCDSGYLALRWFLTKTEQSANNPIMALLPTGLIKSPLPLITLAFVIAAVGVAGSLELEHFMVLFATIFLAYSIALSIQAAKRLTPMSPPALLPMAGLVSLGLMSIGYFEHVHILMIASVLVPLAAALIWLRKGTDAKAGSEPEGGDKTGSGPTPTLPAAGAANGTAAAASNGANGSAVAVGNGANGHSEIWHADADALTAFDHGPVNGNSSMKDRLTDLTGWFDKKWFTIEVVPTYGDTNSVGNVYFASYVGWIGKTRELFFRHCMPHFDIDKTPYFILTRNFNHKFKRETKEFEALTVRLKIESFNRKFVKLRHEIRDAMNQMIGEGEQTLMFVETNDYRLIDIPGDVYNAFIPHA